MAVDLASTVSELNATSLRFLDFCVLKGAYEGVFLAAVSQFKRRLTTETALAIYDGFLSPKSKTRLPIPDLLAPFPNSYAAEIARLTVRYEEAQAFVPTDENPFPPALLLPRFTMFDELVRAILTRTELGVHQAAAEFSPELDPLEHFPGEKLAGDQRVKLQELWHDTLKPRLLSGGFVFFATLGRC